MQKLGAITEYENGMNLIYDIADGGCYDIVFLDIEMPVIKGIELAKRINDSLPVDITVKEIYVYETSAPGKNEEGFSDVTPNDIEIEPTHSFLLTEVEAPIGYKIRSISYSGKINYEAISDDNEGGDDLGTDNHVPTINGGSDIFVTSIADGINIAVAEPQYVGVFAANGALLFNGWVENSVNVALVNRGMYVVVGESISVKVIY